MENEENTGCIGHPITNLLMRAACAADLGAADHADAASVVQLESGGVLTMNRRAANIEIAPAAAAPGPAEPAPDGVAGYLAAGTGYLARVEEKLDAIHAMLVRHLAAPRV
jgi:hypothetical protein